MISQLGAYEYTVPISLEVGEGGWPLVDKRTRSTFHLLLRPDLSPSNLE